MTQADRPDLATARRASPAARGAAVAIGGKATARSSPGARAWHWTAQPPTKPAAHF